MESENLPTSRTPSDRLTPGAVTERSKYRQDIQEISAEIGRLQAQGTSEDEFRKFRLQRGIYGQKQKPNVQMVRVKIPWGRLAAEQLEALADIADEFAGQDRKGVAHVTTRQDVQFHFVALDRIPDVMTRLLEAGLTTREACGNTVRNVTADPLSGVAPDEVFDVSPYAESASRFFLRHPVCQNLPRKFKIAFSGSGADRGLSPMHDLGCIAVVKPIDAPVGATFTVAPNTVAPKEIRGFKVFVGGGLGPTPHMAELLEDFTPAENLLRTIHAVIFVFNRDWDFGRTNRNLARIKFLLQKIGIEELKKRVFAERENFKNETYPSVEMFEEKPCQPPKEIQAEVLTPEFLRWKSTNVVPQKQPGYSMVTIVLPLGDIRSAQLRALAKTIQKYSNGYVRISVEQDLVVRWVRNEAIYSVYKELSETGLDLPSAGRLADITCCPGADTCQLGITSSRGLATALGKLFRNGRSEDADLKDIRIKISGCPNSCGQHHIADIGFYGGAKSVNGHQVPTYTMLLGGHIGSDGSSFGKHFLRVPAKKIPAVVDRLLDIYKSQRNQNEKFREFVGRVGINPLKQQLEPLTLLPESPDSDFFSDWGETGQFKVVTGPGECAA